MKTTQDMIAIMQAYADGKVIEYRHIDCTDWCVVNQPSWDWFTYDYRIKLEQLKPVYRPYASAEELDEAVKEHGYMLRDVDEPSYRRAFAYDNSGIRCIGDVYTLYKDALCRYRWLDGTRFGVLDV